MPDFISGMSSDVKLILGLTVAVAPWLLTAAPIKDKLKSLLSFIPNPFSPGKSVGVLTTTTDVHRALSDLMVYFQTNKDPEGIGIVVALGKHVYEQAVPEGPKPA